MPVAMIACVHASVLPTVLHGSSVTKRSAPAGALARGLEGHDLGVRAAVLAVEPLADHLGVPQDQRADARVRLDESGAALRELHRAVCDLVQVRHGWRWHQTSRRRRSRAACSR